MIGRISLAAALLGATPAQAIDPPAGERPEARVRSMADYLEAVVEDRRGVYIRGYTGQWYYARVNGECPRLNRLARLRFDTSPGGDFDRNSAIRADGWRCLIASVVESDGPPSHDRP